MSNADSANDGTENRDDENEYPDWLAFTSYLTYGYGKNREQALLWALAQDGYLPDEGDTVTVDLVEHVGWAQTSMHGWQVEDFRTGERYELDYETWRGLRDTAISALVDPEHALDREPDEIIEPKTVGGAD